MLLAAAFANPRNQRFVLLSESTLPLYSPMLWYSQVRGQEDLACAIALCPIVDHAPMPVNLMLC